MHGELSRTFKITTGWLLVGIAVFVGVQWSQHRAEQALFVLNAGAIELRRGPDGHYHWPGRINGRPVDFIVDTGATGTAISAALARELGLEAIDTVRSSTAGGMVEGQVVRADVSLDGGIEVQRLRLVALRGLGVNPLLGMDVLGRLHWRQQGAVLHIEPSAEP